MVADLLKNDILTPLNNKHSKAAKQQNGTNGGGLPPLHFDAIPPKSQRLYPSFGEASAPEPFTPLRDVNTNHHHHPNYETDTYNDLLGIMKTPGTATRNKNVSFNARNSGVGMHNYLNAGRLANNNNIVDNIDLAGAAPLNHATPKNAPLSALPSDIFAVRKKLNFGGDKTEDPRKALFPKPPRTSLPFSQTLFRNGSTKETHNTNNDRWDPPASRPDENEKSVFDTTSNSTSRFMVSLLPDDFPGKLPSQRTVRAQERKLALEKLRKEEQQEKERQHLLSASTNQKHPASTFFGAFGGFGRKNNNSNDNEEAGSSSIPDKIQTPLAESEDDDDNNSEKTAVSSKQSNWMAVVEQLLMRNTINLRDLALLSDAELKQRVAQVHNKTNDSERVAELELAFDTCLENLQEVIVARDAAVEWAYDQDKKYNLLNYKLTKVMKNNSRMMNALANAGVSITEQGEVLVNQHVVGRQYDDVSYKLREKDNEIDALKRQVQELEYQQNQLLVHQQVQTQKFQQLMQEQQQQAQASREEDFLDESVFVHFQSCHTILNSLPQAEREAVEIELLSCNNSIQKIRRHISSSTHMVTVHLNGNDQVPLEQALIHIVATANEQIKMIEKAARQSTSSSRHGHQSHRHSETLDVPSVIQAFTKMSTELLSLYMAAKGKSIGASVNR